MAEINGESAHIKLYNLPQRTEKGIKIHGFKEYVSEGKTQDLVLRFHHLDGMYSYCTVDGEDDRVIHLSASTPLVEMGNDEYRIDDQESDSSV